MRLLQREEYNARPKESMGIARYPDIPEASEFQHGYGYETPAEVHGWEWSTTFGTWSALVTFKDGWHGYTYPKPW